MIRKLIFTVCCALTLTTAKAQLFYTSWEYGLMAGASQYFGDLNDNYGVGYVRPAGYVFVRKHFNHYISARVQAGYTNVGYEDRFTKNPFNQQRNLAFQSHIMEASLQAEFNFFRFGTGEDDSRFTPYLTGGVGAFYYNPTAKLGGVRYNLRQLGTEGQNAGYDDRKYGKFAACFPIGAGIKYWLAPGVNFGVEVVNRLTLTDYLDDVSTTYVGANKFGTGSAGQILQDPSRNFDGQTPGIGQAGKQRGNSSTKDQYGMVLLSLSFQFRTYKCPIGMERNYYYSE